MEDIRKDEGKKLGWDKPDRIQDVIDAALSDYKSRLVREIKGQVRASPNPLKAELVHNKGERNHAYYNRGFNFALDTIIKIINEG